MLISRFATVGDGNTFYPGVVIQSDEDSVLTIGSHNGTVAVCNAG